ncbi:hypothetical protein DID75_02145 [Candidatus Marinamargulisbacteria bacterium SCGC AG-410-N11]|nr:hypothetical protein DID75_02145 [Candidatus Marinamargulisbacteria bacterium SCGC AG-410-N11]
MNFSVYKTNDSIPSPVMPKNTNPSQINLQNQSHSKLFSILLSDLQARTTFSQIGQRYYTQEEIKTLQLMAKNVVKLFNTNSDYKGAAILISNQYLLTFAHGCDTKNMIIQTNNGKCHRTSIIIDASQLKNMYQTDFVILKLDQPLPSFKPIPFSNSVGARNMVQVFYERDQHSMVLKGRETQNLVADIRYATTCDDISDHTYVGMCGGVNISLFQNGPAVTSFHLGERKACRISQVISVLRYMKQSATNQKSTLIDQILGHLGFANTFFSDHHLLFKYGSVNFESKPTLEINNCKLYKSSQSYAEIRYNHHRYPVNLSNFRHQDQWEFLLRFVSYRDQQYPNLQGNPININEIKKLYKKTTDINEIKPHPFYDKLIYNSKNNLPNKGYYHGYKFNRKNPTVIKKGTLFGVYYNNKQIGPSYGSQIGCRHSEEQFCDFSIAALKEKVQNIPKNIDPLSVMIESHCTRPPCQDSGHNCRHLLYKTLAPILQTNIGFLMYAHNPDQEGHPFSIKKDQPLNPVFGYIPFNRQKQFVMRLIQSIRETNSQFSLFEKLRQKIEQFTNPIKLASTAETKTKESDQNTTLSTLKEILKKIKPTNQHFKNIIKQVHILLDQKLICIGYWDPQLPTFNIYEHHLSETFNDYFKNISNSAN